MNLKFPMMVEEMAVFVRGDPSVGIPNHTFIMKDMGLRVEDEEDLRTVRGILKKAFEEIYDAGIGVLTKQEMQLVEEKINKENEIAP